MKNNRENIVDRIEKEEKKGGVRKGWWDEECREKKTRVRKELREWKKRGGEEEI